MKLTDVVDALGVTVLAGRHSLDNEVAGGYTADLLSCAMAGASKGDIWVTLQGHLNVIAVASLNELAAVIVTEGKPVSPEALAKADDERIPVLSTDMTSYQVAGRLWEIGVKC